MRATLQDRFAARCRSHKEGRPHVSIPLDGSGLLQQLIDTTIRQLVSLFVARVAIVTPHPFPGDLMP